MLRSLIRPTLVVLTAFAAASIAGAQVERGPTVGTSTTSELQMTATVQTALQLNISTHPQGAAVTPGAAGQFSIDFGDVDSLGLSNANPAIKVVADDNGAGALYTTPISLTPIYSGLTEAETLKIGVSQYDTDDATLVREGATSNIKDSTVTTGQPQDIGVSNPTNAEAITRYVGFYVPRTTEHGSKTATLIYTITIE